MTKYTINELANSKGVSQPVREALLQMADYKQLYEQVCEQYDVLAKELEATNRQVEILSDVLAESRREVAAPVREDWGPGPHEVHSLPPAAPVQDAEGENKAVRSFLMIYGQPGLTVGQMKKHMAMSGFKSWPTWVETEHDGAHLTKAGAQLWIRHLFALESTPPAQPAPVQEPVAWRAWFDADNGARWLFTLWPEEERLDVKWEPLYIAAQRQWVGLTLEEIDAEWGKFMSGASDGYVPTFVRAIEAKLKEKNNG